MSEQNSKSKGSDSIWFGIVLIVVGSMFLARQFGNFEFRNWWALFILIPVVSTIGTAYGIWRKTGRFTTAVWSTLYGALFPLLVALLFIFNMDWGVYWPLFIILAGFGMLVSNLPFYKPGEGVIHKIGLMHRPWGIAIGLSATLLGITFLAWTMNLYDPLGLVPEGMNWWALFILIPALGGLFVALHLLVTGQPTLLVVINFAGAAAIAMAGIVGLLNLDWNLMNTLFPIVLILAGAALLFGMWNRGDSSANEPEESPFISE